MLYLCVSVTFLSVHSYGIHMHRYRLQHRKVLSGTGKEAREATTACLNSPIIGLAYSRMGYNIVWNFEDITLRIMCKHGWCCLNHVKIIQDVRNCNPILVSILGLEISTLGFCRNHMLGIDACTLHVKTEGSGALILEIIIQLQCWDKVFATFLIFFFFLHICYT